MSFMSEFKEFAVKGNVIDLAVGVIIGGALRTTDSTVWSTIVDLAGGAGYLTLGGAVLRLTWS